MTTQSIARASQQPDLGLIRAELQTVLAQANDIRGRHEVADAVRYSQWEGQSEDFRKHAEDLGADAKPFEGAADNRLFMADAIINERVALLVEALFSGEIQATPIGSEDAEAATKMSRVLRWLRSTQMQAELRNEAELLANYVLGDDPGVGVLKVIWRRGLSLTLRELSINDIGGEILKLRGVKLPEDGSIPSWAPGLIDEVGDLIFNLARETEALETLGRIYATVSARKLRQALRELRKRGATTLPVPYVHTNRPEVASLRYMEDIFFPPDLDNIQRARVIYEREWLSAPELLERVHSEGWGQDWADAVIAAGCGGASEGDAASDYAVKETDSLFEIWTAYSRQADDYGIPAVYQTVFSDKVVDYYAKHELFDYPHGGYPYVLFRSEFNRRGVGASRGVPEIAGSAQYTAKVQRDCRTDYTQLMTLPPVRVSQRRGGLELALGPMVEIPVRQADDVTFLNPPAQPTASMEVERAANNDLDAYYGRLVNSVGPELRQAILGMAVSKWLGAWTTAWGMILQLLQEYMDPVELSIVAGAPMQRVARDEIAGRFNLSLAFNVRDLSLDFVIARMNAIGQILPWDVSGSIDRAPIIKMAFRAIDPALAEVSLREGPAVTLAEAKDEKQAVAMMAQGIEPELQQSGMNAELRLQTLQKTIMSSPALSRRVQSPQTEDDQLFKKLVETRMKNLSFLIEQYQQNPTIGRTGARPALGM